MKKITLYDLNLNQGYSSLSALLNEGSIGTYRNKDRYIAIDYHSSQRDIFDVWHLMNSYINVGDNLICYSHIGEIGRRSTSIQITKSNQEYSLDESFEYMGPTEMSDSFIKKTTEDVNASLPVGFRTTNTSYGWYNDRGTQYWLILLIVVIIFFTCSI